MFLQIKFFFIRNLYNFTIESAFKNREKKIKREGIKKILHLSRRIASWPKWMSCQWFLYLFSFSSSSHSISKVIFSTCENYFLKILSQTRLVVKSRCEVDESIRKSVMSKPLLDVPRMEVKVFAQDGKTLAGKPWKNSRIPFYSSLGCSWHWDRRYRRIK